MPEDVRLDQWFADARSKIIEELTETHLHHLKAVARVTEEGVRASRGILALLKAGGLTEDASLENAVQHLKGLHGVIADLRAELAGERKRADDLSNELLAHRLNARSLTASNGRLTQELNRTNARASDLRYALTCARDWAKADTRGRKIPPQHAKMRLAYFERTLARLAEPSEE